MGFLEIARFETTEPHDSAAPQSKSPCDAADSFSTHNMKVPAEFGMASLLALSACSASKQTLSLGGEWDVIQIDTMHVTPEKNVTPFLGFNAANGEVYGFTGCNRLTGKINKKNLAEGVLDFSQMGSTRMLCRDDVYESAMLEAMQRVSRARICNDTLRLMEANGKPTLILKKR